MRLGKSFLIQYFILSSLAIGIIYEVFKDKTSVPSYIFWTYLVSRVLIGMFIFLVFSKLFWSKMAVRNLLLLGISGFMFVIAFSFETLSFFYLNSSDPSDVALSKSLFSTSQYLIILPPLMLMYFAVRYFKPYAPIWAFLPVLFEATLEFVYQPAGVTIAIDTSYIYGHKVQHWVYDPKHFWMSVVYFLAIAWLVIYLTYLIISSRRVTMDPNTIRLQNIFLFGIFFMFIVAPLVFTAYLLINSDIVRFYWISIVGRSILVMGMTLFTYSFYQSTKQNDFFQPQPLESLYILDAQTSELLYKKDFRVNVEARAQENIAANITILNKLLGDALGFRSLMTEINFLDKEFLITNKVDRNIIIILVVEFSTNIIGERYTELTNLVGQIGNYDDLTINPLVHGLFGY